MNVCPSLLESLLIPTCKKPQQNLKNKVKSSHIKTCSSLLLDWNISYILRAFNPVFLIVNFCIMFFEIASASILTSGLAEFCNKTVSYINKLQNKMDKGLSRNSRLMQPFFLWFRIFEKFISILIFLNVIISFEFGTVLLPDF